MLYFWRPPDGDELIYLDHASTTPIAPEVAATLMSSLRDVFGNPSSGHRLGLAAARELERARANLAAALGAAPDEIVFTCGGTESNNLALRGMFTGRGAPGGHLVVSAVEHRSVLACAEFLEAAGVAVTRLPVDGEGAVDPDDLARALRPDTCLVSIAPANHEVGTIQPMDAIARACAEAGVPLHADACQSFTRVALPAGGADLVSVNGHKIHGPKGAGALRVRRGLSLAPLLLGGGQEGGLRSGTPNVPSIAGFGRAVALASPDENARQAGLRDAFVARVLASIPGVRLYGSPANRLCNNASLGFGGVSARDLVAALDREGVAVSRGSACSSGTTTPSPVLTAMGVPADEALSVIRVTLGRGTTAGELDEAAAILERAVAAQRGGR